MPGASPEGQWEYLSICLSISIKSGARNKGERVISLLWQVV